MRANTMKSKLREGKVVIGLLLGFNAPWLLEMAGALGYDFATLDLEHEPLNDETVADLVRTADGAGVTSIVRLPCNDRVLPFLNMGVQGVLIPDVRDGEHARRIVEVTRFYPLGKRTYYTQGRSASYCIGIDERAWVQKANEELLVIGMVEDIGAVERLDEILAVEGIDAIHVGPLDLSQSMGYPARKELDRVIARVVERCRSAGKAVAVGVVTPWGLKGVARYTEMGVQIFTIASSWLLSHSLGRFLEQVREQVPAPKRTWGPVPAVAQNPYMKAQH